MAISLQEQIITYAIRELAPALARTLAPQNASRLAAHLAALIDAHIEVEASALVNSLDTFPSREEIITGIRNYSHVVARNITGQMLLPDEYRTNIAALIRAYAPYFADQAHHLKDRIKELAANGIATSNVYYIEEVIKLFAPGLSFALSEENIAWYTPAIAARCTGLVDSLLPGLTLVSPHQAMQIAIDMTQQVKSYITKLHAEPAPSVGAKSFFNRHQGKLAVAGFGLTGGTYCALVLAGVITGAAAISPALAIAGLTIAALLILAGVAALVRDYCNPFNRNSAIIKAAIPYNRIGHPI